MTAVAEAKPKRKRVRLAVLQGGYDAAKTTDENRRHWANADALSPDALASPVNRATLRNRSRYEVANNSYARGLVLTLANDTIGRGPRLQMLLPDREANQQIEFEFSLWAIQAGLAEKLRTLHMARVQDGEAFAILANNPGLDSPVQLDVQLIEADRVTRTSIISPEPNEIDGVKLDEYGNPVSYRVLKSHPGGQDLNVADTAMIIPANHMVHIFRQDRAGQHRGVPEIMPALPLFAQLRRFTLAVIQAAESAATFAGILHTDAPADEGEQPEIMDTFELERGTLTTMPEGWTLKQVEAEQPATTYAEFKKEILNEVARCLNIPYNVAAGNSSGYNYASGRLDHQVYFKSITIDQDFIGRRVMDHIFENWLLEATLELGLPRGMPVSPSGRLKPPHRWFWDGHEHVDPAKEAAGQKLRLANMTTTLAEEYAKRGLDWEEGLTQVAREKNRKRELGLLEADE